MENEIWKDVTGFEGLYQVSNFGNVKSFRKWQRASCPDEYILKHFINNKDYHQVMLYKDGIKKKFLVHRLVAQEFVPNPNNLPHVNHLDENKHNNSASNLEWCTPLANNCYGTAKFRKMRTIGYKVEQRLITGHLIATYESTSIAQEITGISRKEICACIRGDLSSAGGFVWTKP